MTEFTIWTLFWLGLSSLAVFFLGLLCYLFNKATGIFSTFLSMFKEVANV